MTVTDNAISEARSWSEHLLNRHFRGIGDTIERASHEVEQTYGVSASLIQRLRHREVRDMLLSNWLTLKHAYDRACEATERQANHQKFLAEKAGANAATSTAYAAASLLDRAQGPRAAAAIDDTGCQAKAGDGAVGGRQTIPETTAPDDPASRPAAGRTAAATSERMDATGRRDGHF